MSRLLGGFFKDCGTFLVGCSFRDISWWVWDMLQLWLLDNWTLGYLERSTFKTSNKSAKFWYRKRRPSSKTSQKILTSSTKSRSHVWKNRSMRLQGFYNSNWSRKGSLKNVISKSLSYLFTFQRLAPKNMGFPWFSHVFPSCQTIKQHFETWSHGETTHWRSWLTRRPMRRKRLETTGGAPRRNEDCNVQGPANASWMGWKVWTLENLRNSEIL